MINDPFIEFAYVTFFPVFAATAGLFVCFSLFWVLSRFIARVFAGTRSANRKESE